MRFKHTIAAMAVTAATVVASAAEAAQIDLGDLGLFRQNVIETYVGSTTTFDANFLQLGFDITAPGFALLITDATASITDPSESPADYQVNGDFGASGADALGSDTDLIQFLFSNVTDNRPAGPAANATLLFEFAGVDLGANPLGLGGVTTLTPDQLFTGTLTVTNIAAIPVPAAAPLLATVVLAGAAAARRRRQS